MIKRVVEVRDVTKSVAGWSVWQGLGGRGVWSSSAGGEGRSEWQDYGSDQKTNTGNLGWKDRLYTFFATWNKFVITCNYFEVSLTLCYGLKVLMSLSPPGQAKTRAGSRESEMMTSTGAVLKNSRGEANNIDNSTYCILRSFLSLLLM